jgi:hypothetical protein
MREDTEMVDCGIDWGVSDRTTLTFPDGRSVELREDGYYSEGKKITDEGRIYEIEQIIDGLTGDE